MKLYKLVRYLGRLHGDPTFTSALTGGYWRIEYVVGKRYESGPDNSWFFTFDTIESLMGFRTVRSANHILVVDAELYMMPSSLIPMSETVFKPYWQYINKLFDGVYDDKWHRDWMMFRPAYPLWGEVNRQHVPKGTIFAKNMTVLELIDQRTL